MWVWVISVSFVVGLLLICWTHWILKWRNPKCNAVLPPGSIRETLQYLFCPSLQVLSRCSLVLRKKDSKVNIYAVFSRMVSIIFRLVSRIQIRSLFLFLSNLENTTNSNSDFCICCKPSRYYYYYYRSVKETGDLDADRAIKLREEQNKQREKERNWVVFQSEMKRLN